MTLHDAPALFELAKDPDLSANLMWNAHQNVDDSVDFIRQTWKLWNDNKSWLPAMFSVDTGKLIGCTGIFNINWPMRVCEVGTWIGIPHQRQGFNILAKAAAASFAFDYADLERVDIVVKIDNQASFGSLQKIPGVLYEGILHSRIRHEDQQHDVHMFAMTRSSRNSADNWPTTTILTEESITE